MQAGSRNLITDVDGIIVGNAEDAEIKTGVSVVTSSEPLTAAVHVMGGAPGTRETDLLAPDRTVQKVDALVLAGGSAFGLDAASGVADGLAKEGRGYRVEDQTVPIVPAAILFDLLNGGDKAWYQNPYNALGRAALKNVSDDFSLGSAGAGYGATTMDLRGGLGSASVTTHRGFTVGALVAVNAFGRVVAGGGPQFWSAPFELNGEFGGLGPSQKTQPAWEPKDLSFASQNNTTIAVVATDADLIKAQCLRLAIASHAGMARAIVPSHTVFDGDVVFAAATARRRLENHDFDLLELCHASAHCLARAIARGVYHASRETSDKHPPCWHDRFVDQINQSP